MVVKFSTPPACNECDVKFVGGCFGQQAISSKALLPVATGCPSEDSMSQMIGEITIRLSSSKNDCQVKMTARMVKNS